MSWIASGPIVSGAEWFVQKPILEKTLAWQQGMLAVMLVLAIGGVISVLLQARRERDLFPIYICIGGALSCFYEPLGDLMSHVTYHEVGQLNLTTAFGFRTPLWILPTYIVSFGTPIVLLSGIVGRVPMKRWMLFFLIAIIGGWAFEVPMLMMGAIDYYGENQPFRIFGFPVWIAFVNNATLFVTATLLYLLKGTIIGKRWPWLIALLMPVMVAGTHAGLSLPTASALNGPRELLTVNLMALVSMSMSVLVTWVVGTLAMAHAATKAHVAT